MTGHRQPWYLDRLRAELERVAAIEDQRERGPFGWLRPALGWLRPSPQTLVALAVIVALVVVVLAVAREPDVERPAVPRPQPTATADTPPVWTPQERGLDALRVQAIRDEQPDGLSARQVANRWAQLFAGTDCAPAVNYGACLYMTQPASQRVQCEVVGTGPVKSCTPPSAEFRNSFEGASVEAIAIRGDKASATFTNGEVVELGRNGWDIWMVARVGEGTRAAGSVGSRDCCG